MTLFLNKVLSSVIQIILFAVVPFTWWFVTAKKQEKFTKWIGLKKIRGNNKKIIISVIGLSIVFIILGVGTLYMVKGVETATSDFAGLGVSAISAILVYAIFNTAFPEELLFRGFLLKRMSNKVGFVLANCIQSFLFALLHGVMFISLVGIAKAIFIVLFTGIIAYYMGYVNEKIANGSIIPSWIIHSISNIFSGICAAFLIM